MHNGKQKNKIYDIIFMGVFCAILISFLLLNLKSLKDIVEKQDLSFATWQKNAANIETQWKSKIKGRNKLIDLYGISLLALNKNMVGNFEFAKDEFGIIQRFENKAETGKLTESILSLKKRLDTESTPLVYIQLPNKPEGMALSSQMNFSGQSNHALLESLRENDVEILDIEALLESEALAPSREEFFFHTDVHLFTYAEFWMSHYLAKYLSDNHGIQFQMADQVFDKGQYEVSQYEFLGNTARSAGRFFAGTDCFENYIPRFKTEMTLIDKSGVQTRTGNFQSVVMNGYENRKAIDLYTYWITNYGQYPKPYYQYQNNLNPNAPQLLVIADSLFMRGTAFLSLVCSNVTVVDIRYMEQVPYVEQALAERNYDAVIICGSSKDFLESAFTVNTVVPDLPERPAQTADHWIGTHGICVDSCNGTRIGNAEEISLASEATAVTLVGWAADFNALRPLDALYLQVGDINIQCNYGIERTSVSDHFNNGALKDTGFTVTFPTSYLQNGQVDELRFVQIGADGSCRYEPVPYQILLFS